MNILRSPLFDAAVADAPASGGAAPALGMPATQAAPAATPAATTASTTVTPPASWHSDWLKPDGTVNHAAYERLPDNLKPLGASLANVKDANGLMEKLHNLSVAVGKKGLDALPANAPPEAIAERNTLMKKINGVPDTAQGYNLQKPADIPDFAWNQKGVDAVLGVALKHNISPAAMKDMSEAQAITVREQVAALQADETKFFQDQNTAFLTALQKDGIPVDKAQDMVTRAAEKFGMAADSPLLKYAEIRLMLQRAAVATMEPRIVTGDTQAQPGGIDLQKTVDDITKNPANPKYAAYWNKGEKGNPHKDNRAVVNEVITMQAELARQQQALKGGARR